MGYSFDGSNRMDANVFWDWENSCMSRQLPFCTLYSQFANVEMNRAIYCYNLYTKPSALY